MTLPSPSGIPPVPGTTVAAGVAQTAHTAQRVARERDKQARDAKLASDRLRDRYEARAEVLEEAEESEGPLRVVVDDQMQDSRPSQPLERGEPDQDKRLDVTG